MTRINKTFAVFALVVISCLACTHVETLPAKEAPALQKIDSIRNLVREQSDKGLWTVLLIRQLVCPATCDKDEANFEAWYQKHRANNVGVAGVFVFAPNRQAAMQDYVAKHKLTYPNFMYEGIGVGTEYEVITGEMLRATPVYLIFKPNGRYLGHQVGQIDLKKLSQLIKSK